MTELNFKTERLYIRPISENDIENIHRLHSLAETDEFNTLGIPKDITETRKIVESWMLENTKRHTFAIELKRENEFIGLIGINLGKEKYKNAEVWFKLDSRFWNKGYATESLKRIISFGFNDLNLHRIEAGCATENTGSIHVLEKVGMLREAHTRKLLPLKSGWSDKFVLLF